MNYFELYEIPLSFHPNKELIKKKFYELSKKFHPDRFSFAAAEEQANALQMAALNNAAYKTLSNEDQTMSYVLKAKGIVADEEKYNLPPAFLMEMMDLNEAVSDYEMTQENAQLQTATTMWQSQMKQLATELSALTSAYDQTADDQLLATIKEFYFRKKYLLRIQERIDTFATH